MSLASTNLGILAVVGVIAALAWMALRLRFRIRFKTFDEVAVVKELMFWVAPKLPGREGQILSANAWSFLPYEIPALQSISRENPCHPRSVH
jgi:hypothetical protein